MHCEMSRGITSAAHPAWPRLVGRGEKHSWLCCRGGQNSAVLLPVVPGFGKCDFPWTIRPPSKSYFISPAAVAKDKSDLLKILAAIFKGTPWCTKHIKEAKGDGLAYLEKEGVSVSVYVTASATTSEARVASRLGLELVAEGPTRAV